MPPSDRLPEVLAVCRAWRDRSPAQAIVPEPYVPYVPRGWNGILVLAEAQQLARADTYRQWLEGIAPDQRMVRLGQRQAGEVGVGPWDDGIIKLAVKAVLPDVDLGAVGVGNAVPWSRRSPQGTNLNPSDEMVQAAIGFWKDLLAAWQPTIRLTFLLGKVADTVGKAAGLPNRVCLRLPSPNNINRICGMFGQADLLARYPEVQRAADSLGSKPTLSDVFFACHAVSLGRQARSFLPQQ
jgi:hypothetical protein